MFVATLQAVSATLLQPIAQADQSSKANVRVNLPIVLSFLSFMPFFFLDSKLFLAVLAGMSQSSINRTISEEIL